jgi:riboflavin biosynthesis pyrimidine reductase
MATSTPTVRRLAPTAGVVDDIRDAYRRDRPPPDDRPWIGLCMVTSIDGSTAVDGSSGGLGNATDSAILGALRALADAILVGAGTVRQEGYGPPKKPGQRIAVATNSGSVDLDSELFTSGSGFVLAPRSADVDEARVQVIRAGDDELDLAEAIGRLDDIVPGIGYLHAEGGPSLNGSLLDADLVDEIALTISPHLAGGDGGRLASGATETLRRYRLDQLLTDDDGFLFGRWVRSRDASGDR